MSFKTSCCCSYLHKCYQVPDRLSYSCSWQKRIFHLALDQEKKKKKRKKKRKSKNKKKTKKKKKNKRKKEEKEVERKKKEGKEEEKKKKKKRKKKKKKSRIYRPLTFPSTHYSIIRMINSSVQFSGLKHINSFFNCR